MPIHQSTKYPFLSHLLYCILRARLTISDTEHGREGTFSEDRSGEIIHLVDIPFGYCMCADAASTYDASLAKERIGEKQPLREEGALRGQIVFMAGGTYCRKQKENVEPKASMTSSAAE